MSDEIDRGNDTADFFLEVARKNVPAIKPPAGVGICINCGKAIDGDGRWCDTECRDDWTSAQRGR